jgi:Tfp pilus assembly protein PilZ
MHILVARFRDGEEFLEHYQESFLYGGLFFPTRRVIKPGELVVLDVRMPSLRDYALVRGMVAWHRRGRRGQGIRAGLGIEFLASEQAKRDYLLSLARGERDATSQRRHRRLPTELRVDWRIPNDTDRHLSLVDDIGAGGAFLRTRTKPPVGAAVLMEIVPPGSTAPQTIEGRVAWERLTPGAEGVGIEFRCRDIGGKRRLRELVRRIEKHGANQLH